MKVHDYAFVCDHAVLWHSLDLRVFHYKYIEFRPGICVFLYPCAIAPNSLLNAVIHIVFIVLSFASLL